MDALDIYITQAGISAERADSYAKRLSARRLRGADGKERLEIRVYDGGASITDRAKDHYAVAYCGLLDLQRDLLLLREYGVMLSRKDIMQIERILIESYYNLACGVDEGARTLKTDTPGILRHICAFIRDTGMPVKIVGSNELYCIPVAEFTALLKNSAYMRYTQRDVRRMLRDAGYAVCSPGRYDNTVKDNNGISTKVISLYADDPDIAEIMQDINAEGL
jgi:hypothetical protein